jgi:PAS domain-containing protein
MAWVLIITDEQVREKLGSTLYIIGFAITGCMLLVLAGYIWDQTLVKTLKSLHDTTNSVSDREPADGRGGVRLGRDHRLARKIERMARSLQQVEASYKGIVEDQPDLICRYKNDGKITFVNGPTPGPSTASARSSSGRISPTSRPEPRSPTSRTPSSPR